MNVAVSSDIAIPTAATTPCGLARLPGSREKLLPLLPAEHRDIIAECARGRTSFRRNVTGFDLLELLDDAADRPNDQASIQAFFDGRAVDVAVGTGYSAGPYPIGFDWVVVLDPSARVIWSFVLNCRD